MAERGGEGEILGGEREARFPLLRVLLGEVSLPRSRAVSRHATGGALRDETARETKVRSVR